MTLEEQLAQYEEKLKWLKQNHVNKCISLFADRDDIALERQITRLENKISMIKRMLKERNL